MQIHGKLPQTVALQRVRPTGDQLADKSHCLKIGQSVLQLFRARKTESSNHTRVLFAQRPEFGGCKVDVHWTG